MVQQLRVLFQPRAVAVGLWLVSAYTTSLTIAAVRGGGWGIAPTGPLDALVGLVWGSNFTAALAFQLVLTIAESPLWRGGEQNMVSVTAVVVDTLINAAAIYPAVGRIDRTPVWAMLSDALGVGGQMGPLVSLIVAIAGGVFLAAAPERIWRSAS
jgi:hypothetical protein